MGEAELGLVIGREARDVSEEDAPFVVAGLTTILNMLAEDIFRRNLRYLTRAKSFDTFFIRERWLVVFADNNVWPIRNSNNQRRRDL